MGLSKADEFRRLPVDEQLARLGALDEKGAEALLFDWDYWRRPEQVAPLPPSGIVDDFDTWLVLAGRGFGKTRVGAEQVRLWIRDNPIVNLIGPTTADVRDVMIEGESGIMNICPIGERPQYFPSKARLVWPNGALSKLFSADEPERLRGPQAYKYWADELAAWRYLEDAWDMLTFGLRLGEHPQVIITTTPKPVKTLREIIKDLRTVVTKGHTSDNRHNLSEKFIKKVYNKYDGTRLGRQELGGEFLDDNPNALFKRSWIDDNRVKWDAVPPLARIVVAIDPAGSSKDKADDTGIVGAAKDFRDPCHFYVLGDETCHERPDGWAKKALALLYSLKGDRVVGEVNNGGEMVEATIRHSDPNVPYKAVRATRGKVLRAEPVSALYEQGRVHHVGHFAMLEDQMVDYDPITTTKSPDRMDANVWALTELGQLDETEMVFEHREEVTISSDLDKMDDAPWFSTSGW